MNYQSTRKKITVTPSQAILQGIASDGGLYLPEKLPVLTQADLEELRGMDYPHRAARILSLFLSDFTEEELLRDTQKAYREEKFPGGAAPVVRLDESTWVLELFHGPTCAFKDMALQILPYLMTASAKKNQETEKICILVATSGDTGKAALEGFRDVEGTSIMVYYPEEGVSRAQKLQMTTQLGSNVGVTAVKGNFDDAQTGVKRIFGDPEMEKKLKEKNVRLSSANSINWGRLVPQVVYYVSAYVDMVSQGAIAMGEAIDVAVPTGNFGNILACYLAKRMGLPVDRMICASNKNHILSDFLTTGVYDRNRPFHLTTSPSMDILISSNVERLLYLLSGGEKTEERMNALKKTGRYELTGEELSELQKDFAGVWAEEEDVASTIRKTFEEKKYLSDPHTSVALAALSGLRKKEGAEKKTLVASTASPYKFSESVLKALGQPADQEKESERMEALAGYSGTKIPVPLEGLEKREIRFTKAIEKEDMEKTVLAFFD